jgi:metal-responsive CopG/Arc/MetJ family transcriptional regulator
MQKIMITIPPELLQRLDQAVDTLGTSRSQLIREVLELFLKEKRHQELRARLEEGYRSHAARDVRISEAFRFADYEATLLTAPYELEEEDEW